MDLNAKLDFNVVAVDQGETVHLLLEMEAPGLKGERRRDPAHLQVVLDRSGSMHGGSLVSALQAIDSLIGRLHEDDLFGLVVFDNQVGVPVPAGPVGDGTAIRNVLHQIHPGGTTNLCGGLLRGIQECQRVSDGRSSTLVLLSDGHANVGITDHGALADVAAGALKAGTSISTIGIGYGYDEDLLEAITRGGGGNSHFAENGDEAGAQLASEVDGLLEQVVQAASLLVKPSEQVSAVRLYNDMPVADVAGGFMVELGEFVASEKRKLLFEIDVPDIATIGVAQVCEMELRWVDTESMESKVATIPVNVNVIPGDQAAGRVKDTEVETELTFQQSQRSKREAADALRDGDLDRAQMLLRRSSERLSSLDRASRSQRELFDVDDELAMIERLQSESEMDINMARKRAHADFHKKSRRRGREDR